MAEARTLSDQQDSPYPLVFEAVPDATLVVDKLGVIVLANTKACELFGWKRSELLGHPVERLIPSRFAGGHHRLQERYSRAPDARPMGIELELFGMRSDGTEFPVEIALSPFKMGAEAMVAASVRDLTHTLRFKDAAKRARYSSQVVRLGELALRSKGIDELLALVPDFIVETLRAEVVIIYWAALGTGLRPRVVHGIPEAIAGQLDLVGAFAAHGGDVAVRQPAGIINDYRNGSGIDATLADTLGMASGLRVSLATKSGLVGLLETHSRQPNRFGQEELHFMQAAGNVIVEVLMRGDVEEQLAHAQRLESIGQLTGGIAHDFNNILTVVLGNLQMLREALEESGGGGFVNLVDSAQRASRRGADLTQKLLTISRKQSLAPSAIDPAAALGALTDMLQRTIGEAIQIELEVAAGCPPCRADASQLDNAIVNLVLNARDAMPGGGHLRLSAAPFTVTAVTPDIAGELGPGEYVLISVADSGQGMPPEVLRRAYEPFFTTKPRGKGSGLGLSMVYGFAKQSGGTIRIDSEPGGGTEVKLYFPAAKRDPITPPPAPGRRDDLPAAAAVQETILVVDDETEILNIAKAFLTTSGYRVLLASSTAEALHWLSGPEQISLLFTDVVLGAGETGPKLAFEALQMRAELPVLYTSGFAHGSLSVADVRPVQFLAKPYQREALVERVKTLLAEVRRGDES